MNGAAGGTLTRLFFDAVEQHASQPAAFRYKAGGVWTPVPHREAAERVRAIALGLRELGIAAGDRVAILAETRLEWALVDYACLCARAADVPIYPTLPANQVEYMLRDSGAAAVFCSTAAQLAKVVQLRSGLPALKHVIVFEPDARRVGATITYAQSIDTLSQDLREVRPSVLVAVPRIYEKVYGRVLEAALTGSALKRKIFLWAKRVGEQWSTHRLSGITVPPGLAIRHAIADRLVFSKLRARTGGRIKLFVSGGAPLAAEIGRFFYSGGPVTVEGYGLTETSPVLTLNPFDHPKFGTVGKPIPGVQVKIAPDGEILAKGPNIMRGYYNLPDATREAIDGEGWFHTGDIGEFDAEGYLKITDRKKDLIKTAGGKYVAPQPIENTVKLNKFVANAVVLGDQRKFPIILVAPNFDALEPWAKERNLVFASRAELLLLPDVQAKMEREVVGGLRDLAKFEMPKKVVLIERDFTIESGELTPTLKVKRSAVEKNYKQLIERVYAEADPTAAVIES